MSYISAAKSHTKAHKNAAAFAIANGCTCRVDYLDGEVEVERSTFKAIVEDITSVDECHLLVIRDGKHIASFYIVNDHTFDNDEYVADHSANEFTNAWESQYNSL